MIPLLYRLSAPHAADLEELQKQEHPVFDKSMITAAQNRRAIAEHDWETVDRLNESLSDMLFYLED